jgi:hypothetical protein
MRSMVEGAGLLGTLTARMLLIRARPRSLGPAPLARETALAI